MLSRIANHLFWMARYIERSEHLARYLKVQYYSSLDAPEKFGQDISMSSVLFMIGGQQDYLDRYSVLKEEEVLKFCCFDQQNDFSIRNCIDAARENARSARDIISLEAWEAVNRMYHGTNRYSSLEYSEERQRYDFCQFVIENAYIVKGLFNNTLLQNSTWSIINIGLHLERAIQTTRILITKFNDIHRLEESPEGSDIFQHYQWTTSLRCVGGFDMSRRLYRKMPNQKNVTEFLILHPDFPKSISFNLTNLCEHLDRINLSKTILPESCLFLAGKLAQQLRYLQIEEVYDEIESFLLDLRLELYHLGEVFEREYLSLYSYT